ncbi:efflux RND transporter periplasmic adaptor subunit [Acinetobacter sp. ANC 4635]|uniref:efflux RND transporter periplasmic adaptor subunit n=1 Tax=Acinetobacter sp. ANC 4635 TaxID=2529846 RepID=UPI00103CA61D|nr:efflux RND transporter periplasmic adaptor subunit [Acinetobacter sp. ANC 4635]TCB32821.1 efflux RND transporter periplasmic adaptor subunit [Acinetobacter sp. ANC 4635]
MSKPVHWKKWAVGIILGILIIGVIFILLSKKSTKSSQDHPTSSKNEQSSLSVNVISPQSRAWENTINASGQIAAWQEIIISPEISGYRIAKLYVDVGDHVKKGQLLVSLADDSLKADLRKQLATVQEKQVSLQQAQSNYQRAKVIGSGGALSDQKIEEYRIDVASAQASLASAQADLDSSKIKLSQASIYAVDNGVVSSKSAILGNVISSGTELYRLIRQGQLEWRPEVDAKQIGNIKIGQAVNLTLSNGTAMTGVVRTIGPALSTSTGRSTVYVRLNAGAAQSGMFADGKISTGMTTANTIPQTALVQRDGRSYVYVVNADQTVKSIAVQTGRYNQGEVEILSPLASNLRIVQRGGSFLSEGVKVSILPSEQAKERR